MPKSKVLIVDDERDLLESTEILLSDEFNILTANSVPSAWNILLKEKDISAIAIDLNFEGQEEDGLDLIKRINGSLPSIVLSSDENTTRVVEAMRSPICDFVVKNGDHEDSLRAALRKAILVFKDSERRMNKIYEFRSKSPKVIEMLKNVKKAALNSESPILITGETGTGKEELAKHVASLCGKRLTTANMAGIPANLAESTLFGHVKGSFTGAIKDQTGLIELAHDGMFFLDEIGDCQMELQAKLLRVIQQKEIMPVGGQKTKTTNARFISATNRNLGEMVKKEAFREDLFMRLNKFTFEIPPLRERPEDIKYYSYLFAERFSNGAHVRIEDSAMELLCSLSWYGNVRELEGVIEKTIVMSGSTILRKEDIKRCISTSSPNAPQRQVFSTEKRKPTDEEIIQETLEALKLESGNRSAAARRLGLDKSTIFRRIAKYKLSEILEGKINSPVLDQGVIV